MMTTGLFHTCVCVFAPVRSVSCFSARPHCFTLLHFPPSLTQWGAATYASLLDVKHKYDPAGLFVCHHCVGSEEWDPSGNCPAARVGIRA